MAFAFKEADLLFAGDHVIGWSTTIVAPPDGAMSDYMASLHKLARRSEPLYLSGHGTPVPDAPRYVQFLIRHRQSREASVLHRLGKGAADIPTIVKAVYIGLDPRLTTPPLSVLAHMEDLAARGVVAIEGRRRWRVPIAWPTPCPEADAAAAPAFSPAPAPPGASSILSIRLRTRDAWVRDLLAAVARGRAHVDTGAVGGRAHPHHDIIAEAEDRRARHRLDDAVTHRSVRQRPRIGGARQSRLWQPRIDDPPAPPGDDLHRGVVGLLRRRHGVVGRDVGIGRILLFRGIETGISDRIGIARPQPRDGVELRRVDRIGSDVVRLPAGGRP